MLLGFFFGPSPLEIAVLCGAGFFVLLPEIHRGYCYARWLQSRNDSWLERNQQWKPPRWMFAAAWVIGCLALSAALSVRR